MEELVNYKVVYNQSNNKLIEQISKAFFDGVELSIDQIKALKIADALATLASLNACHNESELNEGNATGYDLVYFTLMGNQVACRFCHSYFKMFNQIYLDQADTHHAFANNGLGTRAYSMIIENIKKCFNPSTICADAISPSGKRFLEKVGFLPNTHPDSKDTNAIYYLHSRKKFLIRTSDLPQMRRMAMAPNLKKFETLLDIFAEQGIFDDVAAKNAFYKIYNDRQNGYRVADMLSRPDLKQHFVKFDWDDVLIPQMPPNRRRPH